MGFTVEQDCPQCGAPVELDEADHLLKCPFCEVSSFLFAPDYFRFVLPHKAPGREILYAPYLRFKGNIYVCGASTVDHRILDITRVGLTLKGLPATLGLRPQAMKMKFVTPETEGSFLRFTLNANEILARAGKMSSGPGAAGILHRAYIGETLSLIYLPLYVKANTLYDAVLNRPLFMLPREEDVIKPAIKKDPGWKLTFMPMLCPRCGWNLDGQRDSVLMTCSNCDSAWEAAEGRFMPVKHRVVPGKSEESLYLPFWKITAGARGVDIDSFADFIRITNQPRVLAPDREGEKMNFWCPAFKIRPNVFLRLSRQFTVSQKRFEAGEGISGKRIFPVTLHRSEAVQSMKVILAVSTVRKKSVFPHLPRISFNVTDYALIYLPFTERGSEILQEGMKISINKNTLEYGRRL